jgi:type I restriction enzyme S subunit
MAEERTLEEVCNILPRSKRNTKYGNKEGKYPVFKGSAIVDSFVDTPDYEGESLIIGDGGTPNVKYATEFSVSDNCYILQNKNKSVLNLKYAYYYLVNNLDNMSILYTGQENAIKHISKAGIRSITIPIHSLEKQNEIVEYCENNENNIRQLEKEIEDNRIRMAQYMKDCKQIKEFWKI